MIKTCFFIYVGQTDMSYTLASKRDYYWKREPQIGFAYLSAVLREQEVEAEILDFTITPYNIETLTQYIKEKQPIFIGFYAACAIKDRVIDYLKPIRKNFPDLKIFIGGPDIYDSQSYLEAGADAYCIGEGEKTIVDLLNFSQNKVKLSEIKGITYIESGQLQKTSPRELIENLDSLPIPAWDKFDLNNYYDFHVFDMEKPYTSIMASRGCPFRCTYCISHKIWQGQMRRRSVEHVLKEIDYLVSNFGVKYLTFQDDIWSWMDDDWAKNFCKELMKKDYKLKWRCILHPLSFYNSRKEIIPLMRAAGCTSITTGLQSASPVILKNIRRGPVEPSALAELIELMKKNNILNNTAFIFGLPGETEETIEISIKYALKIKPTFAAFYTLSVLPGSEIWQMQKDGQFKTLPDEIVKQKCKEAAKRFYTNPKVVLSILKAIIITNPKWFLKALKRFKYLFEISGVSKATSRTVD